jgi:hypothetical protein
MYKVLFLLALLAGILYLKFRNPSGESGLSGTFGRMVAPKQLHAPVASSPPPVPTPPPSLQPGSAVAVKVAPPVTAPPSLQPGMATGVVSRKNSGTVPEGPLEEPPTWGRYTLKHRVLPASLDLAERWRSLGVECIVDPFGRSVVYRGNYAGTLAFREAMEAFDTVPGSCCVQAWTVYVDRRVSKGFDLAAALGAVASGDTTLTLGGGALTLDVGADRIAAALSVIADGGAVELVQAPYARLVDGQTAKVESTQEVPIPETVVANGVAQTSIRFRKVGLQLEVQPVFLDGDRVRLTVSQGNGVIGSPVKVGENEIPVIQSQNVSSTAELSVGQTLVLGGVRTRRTSVRKGLLRSTEEIEEGALYVILSTYSDTPRAIEVGNVQGFPDGLADFAPPLTVPVESGADWLDGELLPPKGWKEEERKSIRGRK